ncbi:MAG TPA: DUF6184 family natural product biosynthesis lipoprotein [Labilithrix sp.]|nr:DUF6184 family natural product biosynthesis lipoprotein [Labilithrix sp.]
MKLVQRSLGGVACIAVLLGCNKRAVDQEGIREAHDQSGAPLPSGDRPGTATITGATYGGISSDVAVTRLVAARCARETACNNVGPERHFVDRDVCTRELSTHLGMDLKPSTCPLGVDSTALEQCLAVIRDEGCNNAVETIERLATCSPRELCMKP